MSYTPSALVTEEDKQQFLKTNIEVTDEEIEYVRNLEQRSEEWLFWRDKRLTGSNFGSAAGHNPHCTREELLKKMLWPTHFTNAAMEYGSKMEHHAFQIVELYLSNEYKKQGFQNFWIEETGLLISKEYPWLGASSDGRFFATENEKKNIQDIEGTLELKAPYTIQNFYPLTKHEYFDQFTGAAAILKVKFIVFGVYIPSSTQINYYEFDENYWKNELFPALKEFYMNQFLPRQILKERGLLKEGDINIRNEVKCVRSNFSLLKSNAKKQMSEMLKSNKRKNRKDKEEEEKLRENEKCGK